MILDSVVKFGGLAIFRHGRRFCFPVAVALSCCDGVFNRALASQEVELTWSPSPNTDIVQYNVYFGTESQSYVNLISFPNVSDVIIPGLQSGQTYYFAVSAVDTNGMESALSNEAYYTAPGSTPLSLQARGTSPAAQEVELSWNPSADSDVYGYEVYYGTESGVYTNSQEFDYTTNVMMSRLAGGATYYFAVAAIDSYGVESNLSNEVSYAVPVPVPLVIQAQAVSPTSHDVELTWSPSPNSDVYGYVIYYGTQSGVYEYSSAFYFTTSGTIHGLVIGRTYYFAAAVMDANGVESIFSNELSYTVPAPPRVVLQSQASTDGNGQPQMQINTFTPVIGYWEMYYSYDVQNWNYYACGFGSGNGDGNDLNVTVPIDPTAPPMFFRALIYVY